MKAKPFQFSALIPQIQDQFAGTLLFGTDQARIQDLSQKIQQLLKSKDPDLEIINLSANDLKNTPFLATDEANMPSLLAHRRLIIINEIHTLTADAVIDFCNQRKTNAFLLLIFENLPKNNALRLECEAHINFLTIACYPPEESELEQIIRSFLKNNGFSMDTDAIQYLIQNTDFNTLLLQNELEKIALYNADKKPITLKIIQKLTGSGHITIDLWIQMVAQKKLSQALDSIEFLINQGENPVTLIRQISKYFLLLITGRDLYDHGTLPATITKQLLKPAQFRLERPLQSQILLWNMPQLIRAQQILFQSEIQMKSNLYPQELCLKKCLNYLIGLNAPK